MNKILIEQLGKNVDLCNYTNQLKLETHSEFVFVFDNNITELHQRDLILNVEDRRNLYYTNTTNTSIENYTFNNFILIPLYQELEFIGIVCLANSSRDYGPDIYTNSVKSILSIIQIILTKLKFMSLYSQLISDNNSFTKDLFLANISHEIKTPLNGIIGYTQLLTETSLDITQKNYLQSMNRCCIQLMQIINDVLDFSKLVSGKMKINSSCFHLKEIINYVIEALYIRLREKRQTWNFIMDNNLPTHLIGDKMKIIQILVNIVSNAIKFTNIKGRIDIIFSNGDNKLTIKVSDTGCGISEEDMCNIFNAFIQIDRNNRDISGTGLGLSITTKLIDLLGGNIDVESKVNVGTTFTITIPYETATKDLDIIECKNLEDKYVLIVDDSSNNRNILSDMLFDMGMNPISLASGFEALRYCIRKKYDFSVGLIDICMPKMSGTEFAEQLRSEQIDIPLIAMSSVDDTFCPGILFEDIIHKPIHRKQLLDSIQKVIREDNESPKSNFDKNILIAEDVAYNRDVLIDMINLLGYRKITTAINGDDCIRLLRKSQYDILLLDLKMPIRDGFDVINFIREKNIDITIIPITASVVDDDRNRCEELGITTFINKPIDIRQIKKILQ